MAISNLVSAIIVAAGKGERFSKEYNKNNINLNGISIIEHSIKKFQNNKAVSEIILVVSNINYFTELKPKYKKIKKIVLGGKFREESVKNGMDVISKSSKYVIIHDGARPFFDINIIDKELEVLQQADFDGVIPIMPVYDALKITNGEVIKNGLNNKDIILTHTPQAYKRKILSEAFLNKAVELSKYRDETEILLDINPKIKIKTIKSSVNGYKLTEFDDLKILKMLDDYQQRSGIGYDFHKFKKGRSLIIGGVKIPSDNGLDGDSDADVLTHSIIDAICGAMSLGDIGTYFGVGTAELMGVKSVVLLKKLINNEEHKFEIINIDSTIICKEPIISNYYDKIIDTLSIAIGTNRNNINIKANTDKGVGSAGKGLGIRVVTIANLKVYRRT